MPIPIFPPEGKETDFYENLLCAGCFVNEGTSLAQPVRQALLLCSQKAKPGPARGSGLPSGQGQGEQPGPRALPTGPPCLPAGGALVAPHRQADALPGYLRGAEGFLL